MLCRLDLCECLIVLSFLVMHGLSFYLFTTSEYPFWYLQTFLRQQMELFAALSNLHCNKKRQFIWYCKINISKNVHNEEYKLLININLKTNVALHYDNMKYHKDTINSKKKIVEWWSNLIKTQHVFSDCIFEWVTMLLEIIWFWEFNVLWRIAIKTKEWHTE